MVAKLHEVNMHLKYKKELIEYYKQLCESKEEQLRYQAVYNLPCMNYVYKSVSKEMGIDFQELYVRFQEDADFKIKTCAASSIHEAFKMVDDDEDTTQLRKCFYGFILDNQREILLIMNKNLDIMIEKYGNKHTITNFKGRTPYIETNNSSNDGGSKDTTPKSKPYSKSDALDFTAATQSITGKKKVTKNKTF